MPARQALERRIANFTSAFTLVRSPDELGGQRFWMERAPGSDNFDLMVEDAAGRRKLADVAALRTARDGKPLAIELESGKAAANVRSWV